MPLPSALFLFTRVNYELETGSSPARTCFNQRGKNGVVHRGELHQTRVQALELAFGHRVEADASNTLAGTRALQPTKENLGSTGIRDCALS